jgi:hypothetical protein
MRLALYLLEQNFCFKWTVDVSVWARGKNSVPFVRNVIHEYQGGIWSLDKGMVIAAVF